MNRPAQPCSKKKKNFWEIIGQRASWSGQVEPGRPWSAHHRYRLYGQNETLMSNNSFRKIQQLPRCRVVWKPLSERENKLSTASSLCFHPRRSQLSTRWAKLVSIIKFRLWGMGWDQTRQSCCTRDTNPIEKTPFTWLKSMLLSFVINTFFNPFFLSYIG